MTRKQAQYLDGVSVSTDSFMSDDFEFDLDLPESDSRFDSAPDLEEELNKFLEDEDEEDLETEEDEVQLTDDSNDLVAFEVDEGDPNVRTFVLPAVPGGEYQGELEDEVDIEVDDEDIVVDDDPFNWTPSNFLDCLQKMLQGVPQHSGRDSVGLERAISYLEMVDKEISKAMRMDYKGEIDFSQVEEARDELYDGIVRLQERLEKVKGKKYPGKKNKKSKKKKADAQDEMVKEAKHSHVGNHVVAVPLIISHVARTCLNSMISAGKDIEDTFDKLATKFKFTPREEAETMQLLADMGYPMRRPRGYFRDEEIDYTSTDNHDWSANYPG